MNANFAYYSGMLRATTGLGTFVFPCKGCKHIRPNGCLPCNQGAYLIVKAQQASCHHVTVFKPLHNSIMNNYGVNRHGFKIPDRRAHLFDARMLDVRQCDLDDDPQRGLDPWTRRYGYEDMIRQHTLEPLLFTPGKHQDLARSRPDNNHMDYPKEFGKVFPHMTQEEVREL
ncbi:hypothetical protein FCULG_00010304 [Fusarium culmorum]|uniref:Uncharacterized protein n=1 Tax=Fusarium culmorum TaxID=5516 RepID=A0A2T4GCZ2_FUSCU|nr:hypothetical protein FCULG_00010304 [Fusarium culmorum]